MHYALGLYFMLNHFAKSALDEKPITSVMKHCQFCETHKAVKVALSFNDCSECIKMIAVWVKTASPYWPPGHIYTHIHTYTVPGSHLHWAGGAPATFCPLSHSHLIFPNSGNAQLATFIREQDPRPPHFICPTSVLSRLQLRGRRQWCGIQREMPEWEERETKKEEKQGGPKTWGETNRIGFKAGNQVWSTVWKHPKHCLSTGEHKRAIELKEERERKKNRGEKSDRESKRSSERDCKRGR